jgi:hypothetical protein
VTQFLAHPVDLAQNGIIFVRKRRSAVDGRVMR